MNLGDAQPLQNSISIIYVLYLYPMYISFINLWSKQYSYMLILILSLLIKRFNKLRLKLKCLSTVLPRQLILKPKSLRAVLSQIKLED